MTKTTEPTKAIQIEVPDNGNPVQTSVRDLTDAAEGETKTEPDEWSRFIAVATKVISQPKND